MINRSTNRSEITVQILLQGCAYTRWELDIHSLQIGKSFADPITKPNPILTLTVTAER